LSSNPDKNPSKKEVFLSSCIRSLSTSCSAFVGIIYDWHSGGQGEASLYIGLGISCSLVGVPIATIVFAREEGNKLKFVGRFRVLFLAINFLVISPALKYLVFA